MNLALEKGVFLALLTEESQKIAIQSLAALITLQVFSQLHFHQQFVLLSAFLLLVEWNRCFTESLSAYSSNLSLPTGSFVLSGGLIGGEVLKKNKQRVQTVGRRGEGVKPHVADWVRWCHLFSRRDTVVRRCCKTKGSFEGNSAVYHWELVHHQWWGKPQPIC